MKKQLLALLALVICTTAFSQNAQPEWTTVINGTPAAMESQLVSSSEESITVRLQVPGFYTTTVSTSQGEAQVITVPHAVSTAHAGEPDVPMMGIPAIIGNQARMDIRVVDAKYMDFENMMVAPSKGDFPRTVDPTSVPYTYGDCYNEDAFFPAKSVELYEPYILRDYRGQNMAVHPFAYNPVTKTLRVYYDITVEMYKVDDKGENTLEPRRSNVVKTDPDFKNVYGRHFINYQASQSRYTPLNEEGDLLIICHDAFISSMTDFVNWKRTRGVNTTIVGTSRAGTTYSAIKTYIQNQYNANNNITHVLLVGDVDQIPGYPYSGGSASYRGLGDNAYGQIVGNDIYNDVIIGRFCANNAARVTTQANRVITYERDLTTSDTWLQNAQGISRKENGSGHNNEDDYQHIDNIRTNLLNYGYTTVYQRYANLYGYTATATQISSDINSGVGLINYANHGQETAWGANSSGYVYYANSHVNALTNENKLPFIFSVACLVGKYDHSSDCFAEAWMNATNNNNPTGAIGTLMSYISQPWIPPMWAHDEFIDILVDSYSNNIKHTWGGAAINGLMGIFDHYNTSSYEAVGTYQAYILYGDPSMMVRTKTPQAMTVSHQRTILSGSPSYTVNVDNGNGAVATITDADHNILGKATVSNGTANITLSSTPAAGSELTLCVFGYNKVTYLGTIDVVILELADNDSQMEAEKKNTALISTNAGNQMDVMLTGRKLYKDGDWNTLCLPFDMTADQVTAQLAPSELKELDTDNKYKEEGSQFTIDNTNGTYVTKLDNDGTLYLFFKNASNGIKAGVPYIIKWNNGGNLEDPVFRGMTIPAAYTSTEAIATALAGAAVSFPGGKFVGNFSPVDVKKGQSILFLGMDNTLYYPQSDRTINAFRAWFDLGSNTAREFRMNFGGDRNASGITTTNYTNNTNSIGAWYDLSGRLLIGRPNTKGMYIHNGHKVVVK